MWTQATWPLRHLFARPRRRRVSGSWETDRAGGVVPHCLALPHPPPGGLLYWLVNVRQLPVEVIRTECSTVCDCGVDARGADHPARRRPVVVEDEAFCG